MRIAALCFTALFSFSTLLTLTACGNDAAPQPEDDLIDEQQAALSLKPAQTPAIEAEPATIDPAQQEALMTPPEHLVPCPEQRPQNCTMEYLPVTGWQEDGAPQEYGNKCSACADEAVVGYLAAPDAESSDMAH